MKIAMSIECKCGEHTNIDINSGKNELRYNVLELAFEKNKKFDIATYTNHMTVECRACRKSIPIMFNDI